MPTDSAFRLSTYLTLGLACLCMGYAESDVLPEVGLVAAFAVVVLGVLYRIENRISLLSIAGANRLGSIIALLALLWGAVRLGFEQQHYEYENMSWPLMFAAMCGMLLVSLILAKLARREKHFGDYWALHGMGLVVVILAGAIAEDPICFTIIVAYAACATWSLSLCFLRHTGGMLPQVPGKPQAMPIEGVIAQRSATSTVRKGVFIALAAAFALPLYLLTPRSPFEKLSFGQPRIEIGYAADQMTNLHRIGNLKVNEAIAFEVHAEANGLPKTDLSLEQRWRGQIRKLYNKGVWKNPIEMGLPGIEEGPLEGSGWTPPDLGPGQCMLTFKVPSQLQSRFLADPIVWANRQPVPIASRTNSGNLGWTWGRDGSFFPNSRLLVESKDPYFHYVQIWRPESDPDLSPPFTLAPNGFKSSTPSSQSFQPPPEVTNYAESLLQDMVRAGKLPADWRDPISLHPRIEYQDRIARAFSEHLSTSPSFTYTTNLRIEVKNIDPVVDFLYHTKSGHCERFASALALLLQSQGMTAVLVLGFKGCEQSEEPGQYVVRQEHAHTWVAALIRDCDLPLKPGSPPPSRWRSLDPTPSGSPVSDRVSENDWTQPLQSWLRKQFRTYISGYTVEQRRQQLAELASLATRPETIAVAIALFVGLLIWGILRRRTKTPALSSPTPYAEWLARLFDRLKSRGYVLQPGDTPLEFATRAASGLHGNPATVRLAEIPIDWVEAYYEIRFGEKSLPPERVASLEARLAELESSPEKL